jgi:hypothetical protein
MWTVLSSVRFALSICKSCNPKPEADEAKAFLAQCSCNMYGPLSECKKIELDEKQSAKHYILQDPCPWKLQNRRADARRP